MLNNDILRSIRYTFDFPDAKLVKIFALADHELSLEEVKSWLLKEDQEGYQELTDIKLAIFLNGLVSEMRGKRQGPQPQPEKRLNNNLILIKLKIALNLKSEDILEILRLAKFNLSKPELSAFFRSPSHQHYRACKDQVLRRFLKGIQVKFRPEMAGEPNEKHPEDV